MLRGQKMDDSTKEQSAKESIIPVFYDVSDGGRRDNDGLANSSENAKNNLKRAEKAATSMGGGISSNATGGMLKTGFYNGNKKNGGKKKFNKQLLKSATAIITIFCVIVFAVFVLVFSVPIVMMATIDYKLQENTGWETTYLTLERLAEHINAEWMSKGKIGSEFAADLENNGIMVGQIAANGEFVRTNTFIADLGIPKEVASTGAMFSNEAFDVSLGEQKDGQLVIKYDNEIISSENLISKLDSDPKMYLAYSAALDMAGRYYYSDEVTELYNMYGLSRNSFASWQRTGNKEVDDANFRKLLTRTIGDSDRVGLNGLDYDWYELCGKDQGTNDDCERTVRSEGECEWDECLPIYSSTCDGDLDGCAIVGYKDVFKNNSLQSGISDFGEGGELISGVAEGTLINEDKAMADKRSASLLAQAVNAQLPISATKFFVALEELLNRARADGDGPVNEFLNLISQKGKAVVTDVETNETLETNKALLNTNNFLATVSDNARYSLREARNLSRDSVNNIANNLAGFDIDDETINKTATSSIGSRQTNLLITMRHEDSASSLPQATNTINNTFFNDPISIMTSEIGGNMIPMGAMYWSNTINQNVLSAMPANSNENVRYQEQAQSLLEKRKEAEREVLSPLDASSPNTFLGSIISGFGSALLKSYGEGDGLNVTTALSSVANYTGKAISSITSGVYAENGEVLSMMNGDCNTGQSIGTVGDIWCNAHEPLVTDYFERTEEEWGDMINDEEYQRFLIMGSGREAAFGTQSADVCKRWKEFEAQDSIIKKGYLAISDYFSDYKSLYEECEPGSFWDKLLIGSVPNDVATGQRYTIGDQNEYSEKIKEYSGYTMYEMVKSLITEDENKATAFKRRYYAEHPLDNSPAGLIARRSGMTKKDAQIALNYADYLNAIARYDASTRMAFGKINLNIDVENVPFAIRENQEFNNELALIVTNKNGQIVRREDETTV